jgi:hypothetical protein
MKAHFFDLDVLITVDNKVWIVDKTKPNIPVLKISQSDFNLIKSGIYKNQGNRVDFNGTIFWLPKELIETIKIKFKNHKLDISNIGLSMQEFMNKELIENIEFEINYENISHLKNVDDPIYIICSRNSKRNYELLIKKFEDKLLDNGLKVEKYYYISDTFNNRDEDSISYKKTRLVLQHLLGFKTNGDKFIDEEITKYDEVYFYDNEIDVIKLLNDSNSLLHTFLKNTEDLIKEEIKGILKNRDNILFINKVTPNKLNKFITTRVILEYSNLIKAFEGFRYKK